MLSAFSVMEHNRKLLMDAEKTINSFIEADQAYVWFEDGNGNQYVPKGKIKIKSIEYCFIKEA